MANDAGYFNIEDVVRAISDKLIRRHPHVFGEDRLNTPDQVKRKWADLKEEEKKQAAAADGKEYQARKSVLDGVSVYHARLNLGETLAQRVISTLPPSEIDVVIPIPESSRPSAMQLAHRLGKPYREGFVKNRYVGRTFIMPGHAVRKKSVRQKLNAIGMEFKGRNVLLVDDSIVRGTTSQEIVQMAREAGARKVYMASAAPPVRFPNVYGIDMPTKEELIAHNRSIEEIREFIGADQLIYQDVDAMKRVVGALNPKLAGFEASCFDGVYITGDVSAHDFATLQAQRRLQFDEEDQNNRSRLALQGAAEEGA